MRSLVFCPHFHNKNAAFIKQKTLVYFFFVLILLVLSGCMSNNMLLHKLEKEDTGKGLDFLPLGFQELSICAGFGGFGSGFSSPESVWPSIGEGSPWHLSGSLKGYLSDYFDWGVEAGFASFKPFLLFRPYKSNSFFPELLFLTKAGFGLHGLLIFTGGVTAEEKVALSFTVCDWLHILVGGSLRVWSFDVGDELYEDDFNTFAMDPPRGEGAYFIKGLFAGVDIMVTETIRIHLSFDYFVYTMLRPTGREGVPVSMYRDIPDAISISTGVAF